MNGSSCANTVFNPSRCTWAHSQSFSRPLCLSLRYQKGHHTSFFSVHKWLMPAHSSVCLPQMDLTVAGGDEFWWTLEGMAGDSRVWPLCETSRGTRQSLPKWWHLILSGAFSFSMAGARATINSSPLFSLSPLTVFSPPLSPLPEYVSLHFLFNLSGSIELSFLILLCLTQRISCSLCLLPPCHPLALSSLTLSSTYLWITNDNGLCSLMWEFCNQPLCVADALMDLIFSDLNAPHDHQQWGERAHK